MSLRLPVLPGVPVLVALVLGSCQVVGQDGRGRPTAWEEEPTPTAPWSSEWLSVSLALIERQANETVDLDDSYAWSIDGGLEFTDFLLRPSLELGAGWSPHDLAGGAGTEELDLYRVLLGGRLSWRSPRMRLAPYVRGGIFTRISEGKDLGGGSVVDQDGSGTYVGAGIDIRTSAGGRAGPFVLFFEGDDEDRLEELMIGLSFSATF